MTRLALIVAVARNGVIGCDNKLPWHLPEDLKWFKANTMGKPMIMGRKTFESLGEPLPGRPHIVISRNPDFGCEGVAVAPSIDKALEIAKICAAEAGASEIMVIGGANLYRQMLPRVERIYKTAIELEPEGDAYFPELGKDWIISSEIKKTSRGLNFFFQVVEKAT